MARDGLDLSHAHLMKAAHGALRAIMRASTCRDASQRRKAFRRARGLVIHPLRNRIAMGHVFRLRSEHADLDASSATPATARKSPRHRLGEMLGRMQRVDGVRCVIGANHIFSEDVFRPLRILGWGNCGSCRGPGSRRDWISGGGRGQGWLRPVRAATGGDGHYEEESCGGVERRDHASLENVAAGLHIPALASDRPTGFTY